jgi:hypothetical protein
MGNLKMDQLVEEAGPRGAFLINSPAIVASFNGVDVDVSCSEEQTNNFGCFERSEYV